MTARRGRAKRRFSRNRRLKISLPKPQTLTDHLEWQLGLGHRRGNIRLACHSIIGNLNEDGYLLAVDETGARFPSLSKKLPKAASMRLTMCRRRLRSFSTSIRLAWLPATCASA